MRIFFLCAAALFVAVSLDASPEHWHLDYNLARGTANILFDSRILFSNVYAEVKAPRAVTSMDEARRTMKRRRVKDRFGTGTQFDIQSIGRDGTKMTQIFWFYDQVDYFLAQVKMFKKGGVSANYMAPLVSHTPVKLFTEGAGRALFVPFDNDKWIRYSAVPFGTNLTSCEVSAVYNNDSREGMALGSIDHDIWKTGVQSTTLGAELDDIEVFGGFTGELTRDTLPHGAVSGETIASPRIFAGLFSDWRHGLETYAKVNALVAPPRPWTGGVPFGWNSWGKLQFNISFEKAVEVSDFFARELQPHNFENRNTVYIGLDS